jgi:DNA-binding transcriptional regulator GbsR (MarR family)
VKHKTVAAPNKSEDVTESSVGDFFRLIAQLAESPAYHNIARLYEDYKKMKQELQDRKIANEKNLEDLTGSIKENKDLKRTIDDLGKDYRKMEEQLLQKNTEIRGLKG